MNKYEELANNIIDTISELVEKHYPEIKPRCITDDDSIENPSLINGTIYYDLEDEIAQKIKEQAHIFASNFILFHTSDDKEREQITNNLKKYIKEEEEEQ